jgi:hypothetical protein
LFNHGGNFFHIQKKTIFRVSEITDWVNVLQGFENGDALNFEEWFSFIHRTYLLHLSA